jgi:hypothetical protein
MLCMSDILLHFSHWIIDHMMEGVAQCRIDGGNTHYICEVT